MSEIKDFIVENEWVVNLFYSIITILIVTLIYNIIIKITEKTIENSRLFNRRKTKTYVKLIKNITRYIFIILALLMILNIYGVNVSSMIAGIGILSVIIGLAIQDFLKDIIRGTSILSDDYFSVGDVIKYKDIEGKVLVVGLKTTKIQELSTSNIYSIANRNIEEVAVLSNLIYVRVPLPYELKLEEQHNVISEIVNSIKKDKLVENCENVGLTELADSKIEYLLRITLNPINKLQVRRNALEHIVDELEKKNIAVPYNQLDIHQK